MPRHVPKRTSLWSLLFAIDSYSKSDPTKRYYLYQKASVAAVMTGITIAGAMGLSFSQAALALAQGPYDEVASVAQRYCAQATVMKIAKGPFYFLVICLFLYAVVVLVFTVIALCMRGPDVLDAQAAFISWQPMCRGELGNAIKTRVTEVMGSDK